MYSFWRNTLYFLDFLLPQCFSQTIYWKTSLFCTLTFVNTFSISWLTQTLKESSLYRLTLFIASSSFIILTLISIISFVSCFILCNEGKDMNVAQRSLIHSMSSSSALNLMAATATHNQLNQINLDHNYFERELRDPLEDELQVFY